MRISFRLASQMIAPLLLAVAVATPARAADTDAPVRTVHAADLNLASPRGVAVLDRRVSAAADEICGNDYARDLSGRAEQRACRAAALASVADQRTAALAAAAGKRPTLLAAR